MVDVEIRRCVVRVRRCGGWSWGPDPRRLRDGVVRALPALIGSALEGCWDGAADGEVAAPISIALRLPLRELADLAAAAGAPREPLPPTAIAARERLLAALRDALLHAPRPATPGSTAASAAPDDASPEERWAGTILQILLGWRARGRLGALLAGLGIEALRAWHDALLGPPGPGASAEAASLSAATPAITAALATLLSAAPEPPAERLRRRIAAAVAVAAEAGEAPTAPAVRWAIDAAFSVAGEAAPRPAAPARPPSTRAAAAAEVVPLCSVLPFLLLGPLARLGWIDAAAATLGAAGRSDALPALAFTLAVKALPAPGRGWLRGAEVERTASAMAGSAVPVPAEAVGALPRLVAGLLQPAEAVLRQALVAGRSPRVPLALVAAPGGGWLLADPAGLFPLAAGQEDALLIDCAREAAAPVVVAVAVAAPARLRALDAAGVRFATSAPPGRGEPWRPLPPAGRGPRGFSNGAPASLARWLVRLDRIAERAAETWTALCLARPALPPAVARAPGAAAVERASALAVATALGDLAWRLWRSRGPSDPLLALERLGDLDGTAAFGPDSVRVRMSLGRRHRDLREAGLLADVAGIPWMGRRRVTFSGG